MLPEGWKRQPPANITLVPKLRLGNPEGEAPASQDRKLELPALNSQAGAWELAQRVGYFKELGYVA
ncbi:MAG: hypothetical protein WCS87_06490 [Methylococcaceae bacterium]